MLNPNLCKYIISNDLQTLRFYLSSLHNQDINNADEVGKTALHLTVEYEHRECVELLLEYKANVNATITKTKMTPLHIAASKNNFSIVKLLISKGALASKMDSNGKLGVVTFLL